MFLFMKITLFSFKIKIKLEYSLKLFLTLKLYCLKIKFCVGSNLISFGLNFDCSYTLYRTIENTTITRIRKDTSTKKRWDSDSGVTGG